MLCAILRNKDAAAVKHFYLDQDAYASLLVLAGDVAYGPNAVWSSWYKSRAHFEQIVALEWSEDRRSKNLSFSQAAEIIKQSRVKTEYDHLRGLL